MKFVTKILLLITVAFSMISCNSDVVFDKNQKVDKNGWNMDEKKSFELEVSQNDAVYNYRFAINLRNTTEYKYNNIFFFITTIYPDGSITKQDTVECVLMNIDGTWKGKGNSDIKDNRFWFAKNVKFPQKGKYTFKIAQATKDTVLIGIKDVGLHIEKQPL